MSLKPVRSLLIDALVSSPDEGDTTDAAILQASIDCLSRHGIERMTVADVAADAGVGRATVLRRFVSKEELVRRALAWELARVVDRFHEAIDAIEDPLERAIEWIVQAVRVARAHPVARRLVEDNAALPVMRDPAVAAMLVGSVRHELDGLARRAGVDIDTAVAAELVARFFAWVRELSTAMHTRFVSANIFGSTALELIPMPGGEAIGPSMVLDLGDVGDYTVTTVLRDSGRLLRPRRRARHQQCRGEQRRHLLGEGDRAVNRIRQLRGHRVQQVPHPGRGRDARGKPLRAGRTGLRAPELDPREPGAWTPRPRPRNTRCASRQSTSVTSTPGARHSPTASASNSPPSSKPLSTWWAPG
ncbi:TetR/AcrR family transcriptional regulator [Nocardia higoensis]|uniref:TetR/AcrR family transcriptional regulator n=1 Tax=Nocardia higoensis TaxID=228599 RepID=A0ABS0DL53_9NOCA|nr:TetR/AcrR family transcriptional regulator [Nocardia higoensis]MBF6357433.1 TetR/AcrR family transcriptional regulator [Nocardia higoensis]